MHPYTPWADGEQLTGKHTQYSHHGNYKNDLLPRSPSSKLRNSPATEFTLAGVAGRLKNQAAEHMPPLLHTTPTATPFIKE